MCPLSDKLRPYLTAQKQEIISKLLSLTTRTDVAHLLEIDEHTLKRILYWGKINRYYTTFEIKKKSGEPRVIQSPQGELKILLYKLKTIFEIIYNPKSPVHGFRKNKSIITNAEPHIGKRFIFNIDIENFFPSIHIGRIIGLLSSSYYNFNPYCSKILAKLCCVDGKLPQGSPASPILANMVCSKLDSNLKAYSKSKHCYYTRYGDDITISTNLKKMPSGIANIIADDDGFLVEPGEEIKSIIERNNFSINSKKTRLSGNGTRKVVTGIVVNEKLNVSQNYIKRLRSMIHKLQTDRALAENDYTETHKHRHNLKALSLQQYIKGALNFLKMVKGELDPTYQLYLHRYRIAIGEKSYYFRTVKEKLYAGCWIITAETDDDIIDSQGSGFLAKGIGLVTCSHILTTTKLYAIKWDEPRQKIPLTIKINDTNLDLAILTFSTIDDYYHLEPAEKHYPLALESVTAGGFPRSPINGQPPYTIPTNIVSTKFYNNATVLVLKDVIYDGNSGGPLLNTDGDVVGVINHGLGASKPSEEKKLSTTCKKIQL